MRKVFLGIVAIIIVRVSVGPPGLSRALGAKPIAKRSAPRFGAVPELQTASRRSLAQLRRQGLRACIGRERAIHRLLSQQSRKKFLPLMRW